MTMGQRILAARQAAGLSQRQLAGDEMTRNMLSALEHDGANPSVATLRYLSERLGKPVSYFLGEDAPEIPEYPQLVQARSAYDAGEYRVCMDILGKIEAPGEILEREVGLLRILAAMSLAEEMTAQERRPYAKRLLEQAREESVHCPYFTEPLAERLKLLEAEAGGAGALPNVDRVLLGRARGALADGQWQTGLACLDAAEERTQDWQLLRGKALFAGERYAEAAQHFHRVEDAVDVRRELEICYRELEDYKMAYYYAKK